MNYSSTPSRSEHRQNRTIAPTHPGMVCHCLSSADTYPYFIVHTASYYSPTREYRGKEVADAFRKYNPEATPTGSQYYVKLPDDTDINWAVPLEPEGDSQGIALDKFRKKGLKHFNNETRAFVDSLLPSAYREGAPLSLLPSTHMYMMEAVVSSDQASTAHRPRSTDMRVAAAERERTPLHHTHRHVERPDVHQPPARAAGDAKDLVRVHGESEFVKVRVCTPLTASSSINGRPRCFRESTTAPGGHGLSTRARTAFAWSPSGVRWKIRETGACTTSFS